MASNWSQGKKPKCACTGKFDWLKENWSLKRMERKDGLASLYLPGGGEEDLMVNF